MTATDKNKLFKSLTSIFAVLFCAAVLLIAYILSPLHPGNIPDEVIINKGAEYTVQLSGVHEYDEKGFVIGTDYFFFKNGRTFVYVGEDGFAHTTYDGKGEAYIDGKYNSGDILYEKYSFCGESYKSPKELEAFFETPDPIYNFDVNKLSEYIRDILDYEKRFYGKATVKLYRGRCVFTEIFIGDELVLVLK